MTKRKTIKVELVYPARKHGDEPLAKAECQAYCTKTTIVVVSGTKIWNRPGGEGIKIGTFPKRYRQKGGMPLPRFSGQHTWTLTSPAAEEIMTIHNTAAY